TYFISATPERLRMGNHCLLLYAQSARHGDKSLIRKSLETISHVHEAIRVLEEQYPDAYFDADETLDATAILDPRAARIEALRQIRMVLTEFKTKCFSAEKAIACEDSSSAPKFSKAVSQIAARQGAL